jgi:hypothetical protein
MIKFFLAVPIYVYGLLCYRWGFKHGKQAAEADNG